MTSVDARTMWGWKPSTYVFALCAIYCHQVAKDVSRVEIYAWPTWRPSVSIAHSVKVWSGNRDSDPVVRSHIFQNGKVIRHVVAMGIFRKWLADDPHGRGDGTNQSID
jgi:hypothetical protein